jgi:hypothetical protein
MSSRRARPSRRSPVATTETRSTWKSILKANPKVNADSLAVGTKLVIPSKTTVVSGGNEIRAEDRPAIRLADFM